MKHAGGTNEGSSGASKNHDYLNRRPTSECVKRIRADLRCLEQEPLLGIYCFPDEELSTIQHALIVGPFDTPYEGGFFYFRIDCPDNYPHEPPKVTLMTTGGGTVRFNPNLYSNGKVCLSILGTWSGPGWTPVNSLASVLLSIQSLMNEKPYHNEPGFEGTNVIDCFNYSECIRHETLRVAVCEMVTANTEFFPEKFRHIIHNLFLSFFEIYELTCSSNLHKTGQRMVDPFQDDRGFFVYDKILARLTEMNERLKTLESPTEDISESDVCGRKGLT